MKRPGARLPVLIVAILTLLPGITGCTYSGTLEKSFHEGTPRQSHESEKIPLSIERRPRRRDTVG